MEPKTLRNIFFALAVLTLVAVVVILVLRGAEQSKFTDAEKTLDQHKRGLVALTEADVLATNVKMDEAESKMKKLFAPMWVCIVMMLIFIGLGIYFAKKDLESTPLPTTVQAGQTQFYYF